MPAAVFFVIRYCHDLKAFALSGRQACIHSNPGRCPGLGASALSGRAAYKSFCNPQACCLKVSFLSKGVWSLLAKVEPDFPIHQSEDLQRIFMPYIHAVIAEKRNPNCKTISPQLEKYFFPTGKLFSHS